jgi:hypothetical protein
MSKSGDPPIAVAAKKVLASSMMSAVKAGSALAQSHTGSPLRHLQLGLDLVYTGPTTGGVQKFRLAASVRIRLVQGQQPRPPQPGVFQPFDLIALP